MQSESIIVSDLIKVFQIQSFERCKFKIEKGGNT